MKKLLQFGCLAAALLSVAMPARAQASVVCKGPVDACARATDQLQLFLAVLDRSAFPSNASIGESLNSPWRFALLDDAAWAKIVEQFPEDASLLHHAVGAFTWFRGKTTYIKLSYFLDVLPSEALRTTMHELMHIARCGRDESCAIRETNERLRALGVTK